MRGEQRDGPWAGGEQSARMRHLSRFAGESGELGLRYDNPTTEVDRSYFTGCDEPGGVPQRYSQALG